MVRNNKVFITSFKTPSPTCNKNFAKLASSGKVLDFGWDGKTASEYKQLDCLGTYDTLSEI